MWCGINDRSVNATTANEMAQLPEQQAAGGKGAKLVEVGLHPASVQSELACRLNP
jgi:hypothetical protein